MASVGGAGGTTDAARPSTSGNANAKKCLEDFLERVEVILKKRQRVKLNGVQTIDWTKLAAAVGAATPKPKPPILPSSRTWRQDLAIEMKPEIKQQLREVFIRYCGWGDKQNFMFISRAQFIRFVRDMGMCNEEIDALGLSGLFDKILLGSLDPGAASRLAMSDFILAVTGLGTKLCPGDSVQESFDNVVSRYIIRRLHQPLADPEPIDSALLHMDIVTTLERLRPKLTLIWEAYLGQQASAVHDGSSTSSLSGSGSGSGLFGDKMPEITLGTFLRFASDFEITVVMLSKVQLIHAFKRSKFGAPTEAIDSNPHTKIRLNFQEFLDCLARCAMLALDYKPPPVIIPTLDFKDCYRTAAKQMWLRQAASGAGGLGGDDEGSDLEMPAAVNYAIGNEDWPHCDEVTSRVPTARNTQSAGSGGGGGRDRLISRAVSIAQGRSPTREGDGMEIMLVHPEPSTMQQDPNKPLHLQNFSCDWVGRPGLNLSETGKLRQHAQDAWIEAGLYHTHVGMDPAYEQRAQEMQVARMVREQHLEALQLHYQSERREQIRQKTRQAAARRKELELQAGQTVARVMGSFGASPSYETSRTGGDPHGGRNASSGRARGTRSGSAPRAGGMDEVSRVLGLEEVLSRAGGGPPQGRAHGGSAGRAGTRSRTLLEELTATLDVDSKLPNTSLAGHGQIRFG